MVFGLASIIQVENTERNIDIHESLSLDNIDLVIPVGHVMDSDIKGENT